VHPGPPPELPELPDGVPRTVPPTRRWRPWTAIAALVTGFAGALVGALIVGIIAALFGADLSDPPPVVDIVATVIQDGALIGSAVLFASMAGRPAPWQFGLRPTRFWPAAGLGAATWVAFLIVSAAWVSLLGIHERDNLPDQLGANDSTVALVAVGVLVCVIAPLAEEIFFRGYFFAALSNWRGPWPAAVITGLVFGGIHVGSAPVGFLVPLAFLGFGLCLLYWRTGSLYPCIAVHCVNNSIAYGSSVDKTWITPICLVGALAVLAAILAAVHRRGAPGAARVA
jgi:membrane protease YdiL (CAAX protease family)